MHGACILYLPPNLPTTSISAVLFPSVQCDLRILVLRYPWIIQKGMIPNYNVEVSAVG